MNYFRLTSSKKRTEQNQRHLPDEVLIHIFGYLSVPDKLAASLVCRQWLLAMNDSKLLKDICIRFKENAAKAIKLFSFMTRNFLCFEFNGTLIDDQCLLFFKHFGSQIQYLTFTGCYLGRKEFVTTPKMHNFTKLKVLKVFNCDMWCLFSTLPSLTELHLNQGTMITDYSIAEMGDTMPNLRILYLSANISFEPKIYKRFYPGDQNIYEYPSTMILSFPAVENFIGRRAQTLSTLSFSNTAISAMCLIRISRLPNLRLEKMVLSNCPECINALVDLCKNQPQLKSLDLSYMYNLNDDAVQAICVLLPSIQEILITSCFIQDETLNKIFKLSKLEKLKLSSCLKLSPEGFSEAVGNFKSYQLKALNLSFSRIQSAAIIELLKQCKCLVYLDLSFCDVTDEVVQTMSSVLLCLQYLKLTGCKKITDEGLTGGLSDEDARRNGHSSSYDEFNQKKSLSNIRWLRRLNLSGCHHLTDNGVIKSIKFQGLQHLNISKCENISSSAVKILLSQNPSLTKLTWKDEDPSGIKLKLPTPPRFRLWSARSMKQVPF